MGSILSFSVLLSLALSVSAAPCEQNIFANPNIKVKFTEEIVMPEANAGLYLCDSAGFVGHCVHYTTEFGHCITITDQFPPGSHGVKSAGSDPGSWCTLYSQTHCHGDELQIHYPGVDDLSKKNWSNKVRSYNCAAE